MLSSNQIGALYMAISAMSFSIMDILVKIMSESYPTGELVFFRGFFGLIPIFFIIPKDRYKNLFQTTKLKLHLSRAFAGTFGMICIFLGVKFLPIAEAITITFAAPIFATIFSMIFLGEEVKIFRWIAIVVGLSGVLIILKPGTELFTIYSIFPLMFCIFFGIIAVLIKQLSKTEPVWLISFYFSLSITILSFFTIPNGWVMPSIYDFILLSLVGIFGGVANLWLSTSYKYSEVSLVTPLKYLSLVFAIIFGYLIWNEIPTHKTLIGSILVIFSTMIIFRREIYKKKIITSKTVHD